MEHEGLLAFRPVAFVVSFALVLAAEAALPWRRWAWKKYASRGRNVGLAILNAAVVGLVCGACVLEAASWAEPWGGGLFARLPAPGWLAIVLTILAFDLVAWGWHLANHRIALLWRFHAVHHSDEVFDATTALRFHTVEILLSLPLRMGIAALLGCPAVGIVAFEIVFGVSNLFVHSNVRLPGGIERALSRALVIPALHRLHHSRSPAEHGRNFGTVLSIWDRVGGTFAPAASRDDRTVGLAGVPGAQPLLALLSRPFRAS